MRRDVLGKVQSKGYGVESKMTVGREVAEKVLHIVHHLARG